MRAQYEQKMCLVISELKRKSCAATSGDDRQSAVADEHVTELQEKLTQTLDSLREKARFSTRLSKRFFFTNKSCISFVYRKKKLRAKMKRFLASSR